MVPRLPWSTPSRFSTVLAEVCGGTLSRWLRYVVQCMEVDYSPLTPNSHLLLSLHLLLMLRSSSNNNFPICKGTLKERISQHRQLSSCSVTSFPCYSCQDWLGLSWAENLSCACWVTKTKCLGFTLRFKNTQCSLVFSSSSYFPNSSPSGESRAPLKSTWMAKRSFPRFPLEPCPRVTTCWI